MFGGTSAPSFGYSTVGVCAVAVHIGVVSGGKGGQPGQLSDGTVACSLTCTVAKPERPLFVACTSVVPPWSTLLVKVLPANEPSEVSSTDHAACAVMSWPLLSV